MSSRKTDEQEMTRWLAIRLNPRRCESSRRFNASFTTRKLAYWLSNVLVIESMRMKQEKSDLREATYVEFKELSQTQTWIPAWISCYTIYKIGAKIRGKNLSRKPREWVRKLMLLFPRGFTVLPVIICVIICVTSRSALRLWNSTSL